jgi:nucleoid-associated protein YgaU
LGLLYGWLFYFGGKDIVAPFYENTKNTIAEKFVKKETVKKQEPAKKPEPVKEPEPVKAPEPVKQTEPVQQKVEPAPVIQAPATAPEQRPKQTGKKRNPAPVASYNVPTTIPREGVNYRIRWGDTLWDIADAFYRNPWLYPRIAKHNNIRNPNLIISGRTIRIPPRN